MLREKWDHLYVVWVNTGDAHADVLERMDYWRERLPHFVEVKTDVHRSYDELGWPADVVPVRCSPVGYTIERDKPAIKVVDRYLCCAKNIWYPMAAKMVELGVTTIYRGQRRSDEVQGALSGGTVVDGIRYCYPIEAWSTKQVMDYLALKGDVPEWYTRGEVSGHDCVQCTGYSMHNVQRVRNMTGSAKIEFQRRIKLINAEVKQSLTFMEQQAGA